MDYGQMKYSQVLPGTIYYWRLYRPTIKGLYSGQIWLVDELQKTAVDCNRGLYMHIEYVSDYTDTKKYMKRH